MGPTESLVLGVVSGIITTAILFVCSRIFWRIVVPWYQELIYRGVDINGSWQSNSVDVADHKIRLEATITQKAHSLEGVVTVIQKYKDRAELITPLQLKGHIWEGFVTFGMQSQDRTRLSFGTTLLKVCNGGHLLEGKFLFRGIQTESVVAVEFSLRRRT